MFELGDVGGLDADAAAALVAECYQSMVQQETRLLQLAAHWADLHDGESLDARHQVQLRGVEQARQLGGVGTPEVAELAAAELGALQQTTAGAGSSQMADALDLRPRLPQLWQRVLTGQVRTWQARRVAQATRHLTEEAAGYVDAAVAGFVSALPWARLENLLHAKIIEADPAGAQARARAAEAERFVRGGRSTRHGLKLLVAQAAAGDVIWFIATVNRIADILAADGDPDTLDVRRSKAIGILASPAHALQLLWDHRNDPAHPSDPTEPATTEQEEEEHEEEAEHAGTRHVDQHREPGPFEPREPEPDDQHTEPEPVDQLRERRPLDELRGHGSDRTSLLIRPPMVDPARLRPPATLYLHLSEEALTGNPHTVARMEDAGPITLDQACRFLTGCQVSIQPGHRPRRQPTSRRLRDPCPHPRTAAPAHPNRHVPLRRQHRPQTRPRPHHPLPGPRQRRTARPNQHRQPRPAHPLPPPGQNPQPLATATTRTRQLPVAITPRLDLPRQLHRHPPARQHQLRPNHLARRPTQPTHQHNHRRGLTCPSASSCLTTACAGLRRKPSPPRLRRRRGPPPLRRR
ncbi:MAG: hypothetical protein H0T91_04705 [Propionibacteriaceae bacterium]|nr:hypothetical protein [Propionibacteriaceae bacterium]